MRVRITVLHEAETRHFYQQHLNVQPSTRVQIGSQGGAGGVRQFWDDAKLKLIEL